MGLKPPFPWHGGKRKFTDEVWTRFGVPDRYIEPFAGSLAILLGAPSPAPMEIVCDTDGLICNFWRALIQDPEAVAYYADWPSFHDDLTGRHVWLKKWRDKHAKKLAKDAEYCSAQAAGWWVWGISNWIGSGFCTTNWDCRPRVGQKEKGGGGQGVSAQRKFPRVCVDQIPQITEQKRGGRGVQKQRTTSDKIPTVVANRKKGGRGVSAQRERATKNVVPAIQPHSGGRGVSAQRVADKIPQIYCHNGAPGLAVNSVAIGGRIDPQDRGARLRPMLYELAGRLSNVIVLNRSWESALSLSVLGDTISSPEMNRCIFLDPPYRMDDDQRSGDLYLSDADGTSTDTATAAYQWAVTNGERYRVVYCCREGDFPVPGGWDTSIKPMTGNRRKRAGNDLLMFSPTCLTDAQEDLFQ